MRIARLDDVLSLRNKHLGTRQKPKTKQIHIHIDLKNLPHDSDYRARNTDDVQKSCLVSRSTWPAVETHQDTSQENSGESLISCHGAAQTMGVDDIRSSLTTDDGTKKKKKVPQNEQMKFSRELTNERTFHPDVGCAFSSQPS